MSTTTDPTRTRPDGPKHRENQVATDPDPAPVPGSKGLCTVIGGTGFLGHRIVENLVENGWRVRVAVRHPEKTRQRDHAVIESVHADVTDPSGLSEALEGTDAVVNAVSLYVETSDVGFNDVHVKGAAHVGEKAAAAGAARLIHISGIGSDPDDDDAYIRARGQGECAVREVFPETVLARPSVMFGNGEALVGMILNRLRRLPVFPLFGNGETRLQPVHACDVARAVASAVETDESHMSYDLAGPQVYTYRDLVRSIARTAGLRPRMVPVPFPIWELAAFGSGLLPDPPLTIHQVALMRRDNVAESDGMGMLSVDPRPVESAVLDIVQGR